MFSRDIFRVKKASLTTVVVELKQQFRVGNW